MKDQNFKRGVASLCIGGGEGIALMVERPESPGPGTR
jgi:acetyl-CoA C-acetyltransferase